MHIAYALALGALLLGLTLLGSRVSAAHDHLTLLGMTIHAHLASGLGIGNVLFSIVTFLVMDVSSRPSRQTGRACEGHKKEG